MIRSSLQKIFLTFFLSQIFRILGFRRDEIRIIRFSLILYLIIAFSLICDILQDNGQKAPANIPIYT